LITPITATFPALNFPKEVDYPTQEDWAAFSAAAELNYGILSGTWSDKSEEFKEQTNNLALEIQEIGENAINAITFDNIAQLKLNSNIGRVDILGYYTKGDGGGGTFYWDSTSTEADNGGTIIQATGITAGRWKRVFSGAVNIKWFDTPKNYSDFAKNFIPDGASKFNYYPNGDFSTDTYTILDGVSESKHYHGTNLCEGYDGKIHMTYRVGTTHYIEGGWSLGYRNSSDGGATWSDEQLIKTGSTSSIFLPTSISMTPSGKIIIVYTELTMDGIEPMTPTHFKTVASVDNGLTWFDDSTLATINKIYARTHGRAKIIPSDNEYGYKLGVTSYYGYDSGLSKVAIYYSDDDGKTWAEGTPITMGVDNANETEFLPITSTYWIAVARNTEPTYFETRDGGTTWTRLGYYPSHLSGHTSVSPTLDKFYKNGKIYVLLGMFSRVLDCMEWTIASAQDLSSNPNAWSGNIITDTDYLNNSGYQAPIANIEGFINVDNRLSYAIIRENLDNPYSLINFSNIDIHKEAAGSSAVYKITSGVVNILKNEFEKVIEIDTEGGESLDDLDTINGGYEGQTIVVKHQQSSNVGDVNVKSGTGNLILNGDYRLLTTNSKIILKKTGNYWYELAREHDTLLQQVRINAGAVTVPKSNIPITLLIDSNDGLSPTADLTTINGGVNGQIVTFVTVASTRDVTLIDGGNLSLAGNYALLTAASTITLMHSSGLWREISRSTNA